METEHNRSAEKQQESSLPARTWAQYLKEGAINMAKDFRGVSLRLTVYTAGFTGVGMGLVSLGVDKEAAINITVGAMIATMTAGEFYFMKKLEKRFPWLEAHREWFPPRK